MRADGVSEFYYSNLYERATVDRGNYFSLSLGNIHGRVSHWFDTMAKCGYLE